jgi:mono/diheme cytochrome c family protein
MAVPLRARNQKSPLPATPDNLFAGREHFADHCAGCHANNGSGDTMFGNGMYPKPPDLRLAGTQGKSDGELYYTIENGVRLSGMPAFGKRSDRDDEDTWKLVAFIRHLPHLTPEEEKDMENNNPKSDVERQEEQEEEQFLNGGSPSEHEKEHHH